MLLDAQPPPREARIRAGGSRLLLRAQNKHRLASGQLKLHIGMIVTVQSIWNRSLDKGHHNNSKFIIEGHLDRRVAGNAYPPIDGGFSGDNCLLISGYGYLGCVGDGSGKQGYPCNQIANLYYFPNLLGSHGDLDC
jgi:hypothetical protein